MIKTLKDIIRRIPGTGELYYLITRFNDRLDLSQEPPIPRSVMIELNNTCNLHCKMCATKSARRKKGIMNLDDYRRIIKEVSELGIHIVTLYTHGEPLLYPDLPKAVEIAKTEGLNVSISTNGNLLDEKLGSELLHAGVDVLRYSIEGASKSTYEKIRRGGNFERLISNMQQFKRLRDQGKAETAIHLNTVVMKETESELEEFIYLYSPLVDSMNFSLLSNQAGSYELFKNGSITSTSNNKRFPCAFLWKTFVVNWDLTATACCIDFHGELQVGSLREKSIQEIWRGDKYRHFRELHRKGLYQKMPLCGSCSGVSITKYERFRFDRKIHRKYRKCFRFSPPVWKEKKFIGQEQIDSAGTCIDKNV